MAPSPVTEDYYLVLEIQQHTTSDQITKSYRRLALKLHPDRSAEGGSTEAFQLLGQAYETLNDEDKRRAYDLIYPTIQRSKVKPQSTQTQTPRPPPAQNPFAELRDDIAQIAALRRAKEERIAKWITTRSALESPIFELQRSIQQLKQEIEGLAGIEADETAVEAHERYHAAYFSSPWPPHLENNEDEKAHQDRARQERKITKDLKERRLEILQAELLGKENEIEKAKERIDAENLRDDKAIEAIVMRSQSRDAREQRNRKPEEQEEHSNHKRNDFETLLREQQERVAKLRREHERQAEDSRKKQEAFELRVREQQENLAKLQREQEELRQRALGEATARAAAIRQETARREAAQREEFERSRRPRNDQQSELHTNSARQAPQSTCDHDTWWHQVYQTAVCPKCHDRWNYLLQCPGCQTTACPMCRSNIRRKLQRHQGRAN